MTYIGKAAELLDGREQGCQLPAPLSQEFNLSCGQEVKPFFHLSSAGCKALPVHSPSSLLYFNTLNIQSKTFIADLQFAGSSLEVLTP